MLDSAFILNKRPESELEEVRERFSVNPKPLRLSLI